MKIPDKEKGETLIFDYSKQYISCYQSDICLFSISFESLVTDTQILAELSPTTRTFIERWLTEKFGASTHRE